MEPIKNVKGTHDVIMDEANAYTYIELTLQQCAIQHNFKEFRIPVIENSKLFNRSVGESSDIVRKEMYDFLDKGGRDNTLRPEFTAGIIRSFVNNKLYATAQLPVKAFYCGPVFRYERPQLGRYRQFNQFGVELIGASNLYHDFEVIFLGYYALMQLGLQNVEILINTLGDSKSREAYKKALVEYFRPQIDKMCPDCQCRLELNPLRILDCKVDEDRKIIEGAPKIGDFLSEESKARYEQIKKMLNTFGIPYKEDQTLVRGLDYYSETVFEYHYKTKDGVSYGAIGAGGHYSNLVSEIGGPELDGVGLSFGVERLYNVLKDDNLLPDLKYFRPLNIVFLPLSNEAFEKASILAFVARKNGFTCDIDYSLAKVSTLVKHAAKANAHFGIIIGDDELKNDTVTIKNLIEKSEKTVPADRAIDTIGEMYREEIEKRKAQEDAENFISKDANKEYES